MDDDAYPHWAKFDVADLLVKEFPHWLVVVRQKQVTLGSCVFLLKRPIPSLPLLDGEELSEIAAVSRWFEDSLREHFSAEKFNYVVAMMKDPYFHIHAFPRYSASPNFLQRGWPDDAWPKVIEFTDAQTSKEDLLEVRRVLADS